MRTPSSTLPDAPPPTSEPGTAAFGLADMTSLLEQLLESIPHGVAIYDHSDRLVMRNSGHRRLYPDRADFALIGRSFEEAVRADVAAGHYAEADGQEEAFIAGLLAHRRRFGETLTYRTRDGRSILAYDLRLAGGFAVSYRRDVTDKKARTDTLELRERALETIPQGIMIVDVQSPGQPIVYANRGFEAMTGYRLSEIEGRNGRILQGSATDRRDILKLRLALKAGLAAEVELTNHRKSGETFINALTISPMPNEHGDVTHLVGVLNDVTAKREAEAQLAHAARMELVGQLASGMAHDFNNLLTVIQGNLELMAERLADADEASGRLIATALGAAERGSEVTRRVLSAARRQAGEAALFKPCQAVKGLQPLLETVLGRRVHLLCDLPANGPYILADPSQFESAILNLAVNARDAMEDGGTLSIAVDEMQDETAGSCVVIAVRDSGTGMPEEVMRRALDPFFTTKPDGKGTGLGLSIIHGFMRQCGGQLELASLPGAGTTVRLVFPRADEESAAAAA